MQSFHLKNMVDGLGRLLAVTNAFGTADQIVTSYTYDQAGNQTSQTDAEGRLTAFEYDKIGRRIKRTLPDIPGSPTLTETVTYDLADHGSAKALRKKTVDFNGNTIYHFFTWQSG
jgi:YD repeat-containing protein